MKYPRLNSFEHNLNYHLKYQYFYPLIFLKKQEIHFFDQLKHSDFGKKQIHFLQLSFRLLTINHLPAHLN